MGQGDQVHIVDGMAFIHSVPNAVLTNMNTFQDFADYQLSKVEVILTNICSTRVDVVYDSYDKIRGSINNAELNLRSHNKAPHIFKIHNDLTKLQKIWSRYLS